MAVIDIVKWDANEYLYAWKFPSEELSTWTQLIVAETQEAVLMKEGQAFGPFKAGRYTLDTRNLPYLTTFLKIPMGGKTPFTAEIWFVNRMMTLDVKWGTTDPIQLQDPKYNIMLPIRAFGQCGIQIDDSLKFLLKLVGTMPDFDRSQLTSYFRGVVLTRSKDLIARKIIKEGISILEISAHLSEISSALQDRLKEELNDFGVNLINFFVNSINTPEDDPAVTKLKGALARKAEMSILGFNYQQERSFDTLETAAGNPGAGQAGVMGAGMGLGMGLGIGGSMGGSMGQMAQNLQLGWIVCPTCGLSNQPMAKFCCSCGATLAKQERLQKSQGVILVCDKCGTECSEGTKFCPKCGEPLPRKCEKCNAEVPVGAKFCSNCGKQLLCNCAKCDTVIPYGAKFCPECGSPLTTQEGK